MNISVFPPAVTSIPREWIRLLLKKVQDAMMLAMEDPDYQENMTKLGLGLMPMKGDDFYNLLASQLGKP